MTYNLRLLDQESGEVKTKCTKCNIPTIHEWKKVIPVTDQEIIDPLAELALVRRIILCTECGNLSLKQ